MDFLVTEAVALKVAEEDRTEQKKQERESWKGDRKGLKDALAGVQ